MTEEYKNHQCTDIQSIMKRLPHRYPFLLVDRVIRQTEKNLVAIKNVTINEPFFQGHFPQAPIMPGVLIVEALAQASGLLWIKDSREDAQVLLAKVDGAKFFQPVVPGDQLELDTTLLRHKAGFSVYECFARVDGKIVAQATLTCKY